MAKFHINPETGNANVCTAKVKCKFTSDDGVEPPHYLTKQEAQLAAEEQLSSRLPTIPSLKNTVEIQEPKGDPRTPNEIAHDLVDLTKKIAALSASSKAEFDALSKSLEDYDATWQSGVRFDSKTLENAYTAANLAIRKFGITRKELLTARSQLNEEHLIREQKLYPNRAFERGVTLATLQPQSGEGRQLLNEMKKALEDSEKELALSKRATDNLVNRHENGRSGDSSSMKASFAYVNDSIAQSNRMIQHARALKRLSDLAEDYRKAEDQSWSGRARLETLEVTGIEKLVAESKTPSQIEVYSRMQSGQDQNQINQRYINILESERSNLVTGSDERNEMNRVIKAHRDNVNYNQTQWLNTFSEVNNTEYRGFISGR
jgi:hypothetical protein